MWNHCSPSANVAGIPSCGTVHEGPGGGAWIDEKHIHNVKHYVLVKICISVRTYVAIPYKTK